MPKFTPKFQAENGLNLSPFVEVKRSMFPVIPSGAGALNTDVWPDFPLEQFESLDSVQRVMTRLIGESYGIPTFGRIVENQVGFLRSAPAYDPLSKSAQVFNAAIQGDFSPQSMQNAVDLGLDVINGLGLDALQGATEVTSAVTGVVDVVPFIGLIVKLGVELGKLGFDALKPKDWKSLKVPRPTYDPDNDYVVSKRFQTVAASRDWTAMFSPADFDLDLAVFTTGTTVGTTMYPTFAGRRTDMRGEWVFGQWNVNFQLEPNTIDHLGFIPQWDGGGGRLWRGVMVTEDADVWVGDSLPTAQSIGLEMWRACFNPYAPQIFFVDAVRLGNEWLNYLVLLRRALHVSHTKEAFQALKNIKGNTLYGDGPVQDRMWLSFSSIEDGDLKKKMALRKQACDAMARVFGWRKWGSDDEDMVRKLSDVQAVSDAEYIERFGLNNAAPVNACRGLYRRQLDACQSTTSLYSFKNDVAFTHAPELRQLRDRAVQNAIMSPERRGEVDQDMVVAFQEMAQQLSSSMAPAATVPVSAKAAIYKPAQIWLGEHTPPGAWGGQDPGKTPAGTGGGGAAIAVGAAAAAAYFFMGR